MSECCKIGFRWDGKPTGKESTLAGQKAYVSGTNKDVAILIVHDIFGWTLNNTRLLADHYAEEADATVYLPDFFEGEVVEPAMMEDPEKRKNFDMMAMLGRNGKEKRFPEMEACAKALKSELGFKKVGTIGFCYGGWAVFQLGGEGKNLVDCVSTAHPSLLTKEEIDNVRVPVQILAPEHDPMYGQEMKDYSNTRIPTFGVRYDYQYFPGVAHGFSTRGDQKNPVAVASLERAKNAAVSWFVDNLH